MSIIYLIVTAVIKGIKILRSAYNHMSEETVQELNRLTALLNALKRKK